MPYKDRDKQLAAMKQWRQDHLFEVRDYEENRRERPDDYWVKQKGYEQQRYAAKNGPRQFVGCDGEGMGDGSAHDYYVFRMGGACLKTGQPLTSTQILEFIVSQPHGPIYCIYSGNYDFTMVLRGLPNDVIQKILHADRDDSGNRRYVHWEGYRIEYLPHKRLAVGRGDKTIVIHDVFGFFQSTFVTALEEWNIGTPDQRARIAAGKLRRGDTDVLSEEELEYNRIECELLEQMMYKLDEATSSLMLSASPYEGAGAIANSLFQVHISKPIRERNNNRPLADKEPETFRELDPHSPQMPTWDGYYGGRFEITAHGPIRQPVYEYDINSAYPAVITNLPCLHHGKWVHENIADHGVRFGYIRWGLASRTMPNFGPLPHRNRQGNITFPLLGAGWYWSVEWPTDPAGYEILDCWTWVQNCDHRPFYWVADRYEQRKAHKSAGRKGQAMMLKLGYNSLYGKMAQNVGKPRWRNSVYAGLVTATCRRWLRDAGEQNPDAIVMFATDGIYSLEKLDLELGNNLGQWEYGVYEHGLHLVRPGIYFEDGGEAKVKSRGIARKVVSDYSGEIVRAFDDVYSHPEWLLDVRYAKLQKEWGVPLEYNGLVSLRLAHAQNHPERAGYFGRLPHFMSYSMFPKRLPSDFYVFERNWRDGILRSNPPVQWHPFQSLGYGKSTLADDDWGMDMVETAPDMESAQQLEMEWIDVP